MFHNFIEESKVIMLMKILPFFLILSCSFAQENKYIKVENHYEHKVLTYIKEEIKGSFDQEDLIEDILRRVDQTIHPDYPGSSNEFKLRKFRKILKEKIQNKIKSFAYNHTFMYPFKGELKQYDFENKVFGLDGVITFKDHPISLIRMKTEFPNSRRGTYYVDIVKCNEELAEKIVDKIEDNRNVSGFAKLILVPLQKGFQFCVMEIELKTDRGDFELKSLPNDLPNIFLPQGKHFGEIHRKNTNHPVMRFENNYPMAFVDDGLRKKDWSLPDLKNGNQYEVHSGIIRNKFEKSQYSFDDVIERLDRIYSLADQKFIKSSNEKLSPNFVMICDKSKKGKWKGYINGNSYRDPIYLTPGAASYKYNSTSMIWRALGGKSFSVPEDKKVVVVIDWNKLAVSKEKIYFISNDIDITTVTMNNLNELGAKLIK